MVHGTCSMFLGLPATSRILKPTPHPSTAPQNTKPRLTAILAFPIHKTNLPQIASKWVSFPSPGHCKSFSLSSHVPTSPSYTTSASHLPFYFPHSTLFSPILLILITLIPVSLDTAIALSFGILSAFISLIGVLLSYLTLRATTTNNCKHISYP